MEPTRRPARSGESLDCTGIGIPPIGPTARPAGNSEGRHRLTDEGCHSAKVLCDFVRARGARVSRDLPTATYASVKTHLRVDRRTVEFGAERQRSLAIPS